MTELNFLYWLRGFLEAKIVITKEDATTILQHANLVHSKTYTVGYIAGYLAAIKGDLNIEKDLNEFLSLYIKEIEKIPISEKIPIFTQLYPLQQYPIEDKICANWPFDTPEPSVKASC